MSAPPAHAWLRARIRRVPVLGSALRGLYYGGRQQFKYVRGGVLQLSRELCKRRQHSARSVTRRNDKRAYERLYSSSDLLADYLRPSRLQFYEEVADVCASFRPARIVDVGCGTGHLLEAVLRRADNDPEAVGIDYAESAIARARELVPSADWLVGDVYTLDDRLDARFDLVLSTEVLEHLERPVEALERLARLCTPSGVLVLTVPDGAMDNWEGHVNFWDENDFRLMLAPLGHVDVRRIDEGRTLLGVVAMNHLGR